MSWNDIISDPDFQKESPEVKQQVANNYFERNFATDPEYLKEPDEVKATVRNNFLKTIEPRQETSQIKPEFESNIESVSESAEGPTVSAVPSVMPGTAFPGLSNVRQMTVRPDVKESGPLSKASRLLTEVALPTLRDVGGVVAKMGAGAIKGLTVGAINPEEGTIGIPFTSKKMTIAEPLDKSLQSLGVQTKQPYFDTDIAAGGAEMATIAVPWSATSKLLSKGVNALKALRAGKEISTVVKTGEEATKISKLLSIGERVAEQGAAGAIIGAAGVRQPEKKGDYTPDVLKQFDNMEERLLSIADDLKKPEISNETKKALVLEYNQIVDDYKQLSEEGQREVIPGESILKNTLTTAAMGAGLQVLGEGVVAIAHATGLTKYGAYNKLKEELTDIFFNRSERPMTKTEANKLADMVIAKKLQEEGISLKDVKASELRQARKDVQKFEERVTAEEDAAKAREAGKEKTEEAVYEEAPETKAKEDVPDATIKREKPESNISEHQEGDRGGEAAETGRSDSIEQRGQEKASVEEILKDLDEVLGHKDEIQQAKDNNIPVSKEEETAVNDQITKLKTDLKEAKAAPENKKIQNVPPVPANVPPVTDKEVKDMTLDELMKARKWDAEPAAAIPGEPIEWLGDDIEKSPAALFSHENGKLYIQRNDGTILYNPAAKGEYFDNADDAWEEYHKQEIQQEKEVHKSHTVPIIDERQFKNARKILPYYPAQKPTAEDISILEEARKQNRLDADEQNVLNRIQTDLAKADEGGKIQKLVDEVDFYDRPSAEKVVAAAKNKGHSEDEIISAFREGEETGDIEGSSLSSAEIENRIDRLVVDLNIRKPSVNYKPKKVKTPENAVTRIIQGGGIKVDASYNKKLLKEDTDLKRVIRNNAQYTADEWADILNGEGYNVGTGDDLDEALKSGAARKILNPEKQETIINREIKRQENDYIERAIADLEAEEIDSGRIEASRADIEAGLTGALEAEGYSPEEIEANAAEVDSFFDDIIARTKEPRTENTDNKTKPPYFTLKKAKDVVRQNFKDLSDEKLQKTYVTIRDYERYVNNSDAYHDILIEGGYYTDATTQASSGYVPKDIWLAQNLKTALDEVSAERNRRIKQTEIPGASEAETFSLNNPTTDMSVHKPLSEQKTQKSEDLFAVKNKPEPIHIDVNDSMLSMSLPDFISKARQTAKDLFSGKKFRNKIDGSEILVPWRGIKHALSGKVNRNEAAIALKLNKIIESATPERIEQDKKGRNTIKAVHFYNVVVIISDREVNVELVVREHLDGKRYYDHYEIKERSAGQSGEPEINQGSLRPFTNRSLDNNIPPSNEVVNTKQSWQMTPEEYSGNKSTDERAVALAAHPQHVKDALAEGKNVPIEVLEKYKNNVWAQKAIEKLKMEGPALNKEFVFPLKRVESAYSHLHLSPGNTAKVEENQLNKYAEELRAKINKYLPTLEPKKVDEYIDNFKRDYVENRESVWSAASVAYSRLTAGNSNFNSKQAERRGNALDRAEERFTQWLKDKEKNIESALGIDKLKAEEKAKKEEDQAQAKEKAKIRMVQMWDALKVGDTIDVGGNSRPVITKKNKFSVETEGGAKWTLKEVFGVDHKEAQEILDSQQKKTDAFSLSFYDDFMNNLRNGKATLQELKDTFSNVINSKDVIIQELSGMTKDAILKRMGGIKAYQYKNDKKDRIIQAAYSDMLDDFTLAKGVSFQMGEKYENVVARMVEKFTDEDLIDFAKRVEKSREDYKKRREEFQKALTNPETLDEFKQFIEARGKDKLTPEQTRKYEDLISTEIRKEKKIDKERKTAIREAGRKVGAEIVETKHTKTGEALFVVRLDERVEREIYNEMNRAAKKMGGWYSSYKVGGAVPGFQFKTKEAAEAFKKYVSEGDTETATEVAQERKEVRLDEKRTNAVTKLRAMSERLTEKANEELNRDRQTNTARRARMANGAEESAIKSLRIADTMKNIADAIEAGEVTHLSGLRTKAQIEMLNGMVTIAQYNELREKYKTYSEQENHKGEPATIETVDYMKPVLFPQIYKRSIMDFAKDGLEKEGIKRIAQKWYNRAEKVNGEYINITSIGEMDELKKLSDEVGGSWSTLSNVIEDSRRMHDMGIETPEMERAALREFIQYRAGLKEADKAKLLERSLIGKNVGFDFFPTPKETAEQMVIEADISKGMDVLEPSAGNGNIAEVIREAGVEPDTAEISGSLRDVLEAKNFNLVAHDFMDMKPPAEFKYEDYSDWSRQIAKNYTRVEIEKETDAANNKRGGLAESHLRTIDKSTSMSSNSQRRAQSRNAMTGNYEKYAAYKNALEIYDHYPEHTKEGGEQIGGKLYDRIIMNPPFSKSQDIEHVQHAYDLLKPGGKLVAIMGEGAFFRSDKKAVDFREWLDNVGGRSEKLPERTFTDKSLMATTGVNSRMVVIEKSVKENKDLFLRKNKSDIIVPNGGKNEGQTEKRPSAYDQGGLGERQGNLSYFHKERERQVGIERQVFSKADYVPIRFKEACQKGQGIAYDPEGYDTPEFKEVSEILSSHGLTAIPVKVTDNTFQAYIRDKNVFLNTNFDDPEVSAKQAALHELSHDLKNKPLNQRTRKAININSQAFRKYRKNLSEFVDATGNFRFTDSEIVEEISANLEAGINVHFGVNMLDTVKKGGKTFTLEEILKDRKISDEKSVRAPPGKDAKFLWSNIETLTEKQKEARKRIERNLQIYGEEAQKAGQSLDEYLKSIGMSDAQITRLMEYAKAQPVEYPGYREIKPDEILQPGADVKMDFVSGKSYVREQRTTGIKNAVAEEEREARNLFEVEHNVKKVVPAFDEGKRLVDSGEINPRIMAEELAAKPRSTTDVENAILLYDRMRLYNEHKAVMDRIEKAVDKGDTIAEAEARVKLEDIEDAINTNDEASRHTGTEWSAAGRMRQQMIKEDYSLAAMLQRARVENGGKPLSANLRAKYEALCKQIEEANEKLKKYEEEAAKREAEKAVQKIKNEEVIGRHLRQVRQKKAVAQGKLDAEFSVLVRDFKRSLAGIHFVFDPDTVKILSLMARNRVMAGTLTPDGIVNEIYEQIKDENPDITKRDIRDAISGYGRTSQPSREEIEVQLRETRRQMRLISAYEDATAGQAPLRSGFQHEKSSDKVRELSRLVRQAMRESGIDSESTRTPEEQWKTALEAVKTRLRNQITDLNRQIETGEKTPKKIGIKYDEEALFLKAERDRLKDVLISIEGKPELSPEQKIKMATAAVEKSIAEYERRITEKDLSPKKAASTTPETPELRMLREKRDNLKNIYKEMQEEAKPKRTPEEIALKSFKTRTANRIAELEEKLKTGDFSKKARRKVEIDKEGLELKFKLGQAIRKYNEALIQDRLANRTTMQKIGGKIGEAINLSRAIKTSMDLSAVLRQGAFIVFAHPIRGAESIPGMLKAFASEKGQFEIEDEILHRPNYRLYEQSKLFLSEHGQKLSQMEEAYMSRWAEKIPLVGASQRAYTTFLNKLRADSFDVMVANLAKNGEKPTDKELNAIANYINVATGRGNLGAKENALVGLNTVFFAPRYVASRFQLIAGQPLYRGSARTRKMIVKEYGRFLIGLGAVYALGLAMGAEVEVDPRSSDFGKIKIGKTRVDPLAGMSQSTVLVSRLISGETKTSKGRVIPIRGNKVPYGSGNSADVLARFLRSKLSPVVGTGVDIAAGKDYIGEKVTIGSMPEKLLMPLSFNDIYDTMKEQGVPAGSALSILSIMGMGVQTYDNKKTKRD